MLDEIDPLDYVLAENLGKTLAEIRAMPSRDFAEWRAFLYYRSEMQQLHSKG